MRSSAVGREFLDFADHREVAIGVVGIGHADADAGGARRVPGFLPVALGIDEQAVVVGVVVDPDGCDVWQSLVGQGRDVGERLLFEQIVVVVGNRGHGHHVVHRL